MITLRKRQERGSFDHGWLQTAHTFSFADYHDPAHMGFRSLRVINEDTVAPGGGFPTHPHRDMEILTWVLAGALRHQDSMGNGSVIRPGDVQIMSAGTGILHSEHNDSRTEPVHLLQIWVHPDKRGLPPRYDQRTLDRRDLQGVLAVLAAPPGEAAAVSIHQDARILATRLEPGQQVSHPLRRGRGAWLQVAAGRLQLNGSELRAGDGATIEAETNLQIAGVDPGSEALLFDLG
jgi:hypothetical protein